VWRLNTDRKQDRRAGKSKRVEGTGGEDKCMGGQRRECETKGDERMDDDDDDDDDNRFVERHNISIIIIIIIPFTQGIHTYVPETNHVSRVHSAAAIPHVLLMVHISLSAVLNSVVLLH
jgi:hypothetical protein